MGIGASVLLLAVGAILAFAVEFSATPVGGISIEWDTVGVILMLVGVLGLLWSIMAMNAWRDRRHDVVDDGVVRDRERIIER